MGEEIEQLLGHPVSQVVAIDGHGLVAAVSRVGDPATMRVAWVDTAAGQVLYRMATPPGRPSRFRPVVAAVMSLDGPSLPSARIMVGHLAATADALRPVLMDDPHAPAVAAAADGLAVAVLRPDSVVLAVDALDRRGEPIGRLVRSGISELRYDGVTVGGHLRATHGMGAGIGAGHWVRDSSDAAFEAGYSPARVGWIPPGFAPGPPRVEPDGAYPAAPPALIWRWEAADGARVLLRQAPAPLANPDQGGAQARSVTVGAWPAVLRARGPIATLVWETAEHAFGLQVRGVADPVAVAMRVAAAVETPA